MAEGKRTGRGGRPRSIQYEFLQSVTLILVLAMLISYGLTTYLIYRQSAQVLREEIFQQAEYIAAAINVSGEEYLKNLDETDPDTRFTLIDPAGNVLYDTDQKSIAMENHLDRPEIQEAIESGKGFQIRQSDSLGTEMYYAAMRLEDGNILRTSRPARTAFFMAMRFLPAMIILVLVILMASWYVTRVRIRSLVGPINRLDLEEPLGNDLYIELRPLLRRIDTQNREKEAVAGMRKEFSANVSHELKTPLTSISGYAEIMKSGLVRAEDTQEFADRIYKEAQRMIKLIDDIIRLSRLDEGSLPETETVDLHALAAEALETLRPAAAENGVRLSAEGEACEICGVRQILEEIIYNLAENAIKYNKKGGSVTVWTGPVPGGKALRVTDTGIGIPESEQERIFERFYRVDKSHSRTTGGTGLGLSIVKHGVLLHGGLIRLESRMGEGTRIEVFFPDPEKK